MGKTFAPRVSKRKREVTGLNENLKEDIFNRSDEKLLSGARLTEMKLATINVNDQVRTKFNDRSIKELANNIKVNGLIQPLVLHKRAGVYTLICGERRFRAMSSIEMVKAPCFVLENKTDEELMAIQFSENSSREALHYIDRADGILNYKLATNESERKIQVALGISKSEVHRSLIIAKLPHGIKEAAKIHDIEKYVLVEFDAIDSSPLKKKIEKNIIKGEITKRSELKKALIGVISTGKRSKSTPTSTVPRGLTANAFIKAMSSKSKSMKLDKKTRELIDALVEESKGLV
jgi:ParB family chromosome partitioning protein